ncbi:MAG: Spy/CpxP family protein refolding chaperone [Pseudomonadota bacterium]
MTRLFQKSLAPLTALGLLLASPAIAQTPAPDPHHPAGAPAAAASPAPGMMTPMMCEKMMPMMGQMMGGGMMAMQAGPQGMMGADMRHPMMGMMITHSEGVFAFLKTEIGITDAQNTVWNAYTAQLKPLIKQHQDKMQMTPDAGAKPRNWIERLTDSETILSEHLETMKKIRPAATALYAALTPEQKTKADALMPLMPGAVGMKMGGKPGGK